LGPPCCTRIQATVDEVAPCDIPFIYSYIPLACVECDDSLPFSGASIPLYYVLFPATLLHQLFFHSVSPHLALYFLVHLSILLFPHLYIIATYPWKKKFKTVPSARKMVSICWDDEGVVLVNTEQ